jgi:5-formaminoimidazole-4-carboxamide-1-beta-D-ribofuranosyl 5'-monophosphate synthetase
LHMEKAVIEKAVIEKAVIEKAVIEKAVIGNEIDEEFTSIRISKRTLNYLGKLGRFKQTWNDVKPALAPVTVIVVALG